MLDTMSHISPQKLFFYNKATEAYIWNMNTYIHIHYGIVMKIKHI